MLRYSADLRPLFFNAVYFACVAYVFTSGFALAPTVTTFAMLAVICVTAFMGAVQTHNAIHCPVFKNRTANKIYQAVLTLIYGHPTSSYVPGHNLSHHKHTQTRRDVMRTTKARLPYHLLNLFFFFPRISKDIMRADTAYTKAMRTRHPRWFRQMVLEVVVLWSVTIALFVIDWRKALVFWLVPHLYAQWGIVTFNLLQHDGCDENSDYNHSRNFVGRFVNWWTFNNGFHTIHHMHPGLHWSLAPEAHAREVAPHIHPNLDQASLAVFILRAFVLNQRLTYDGKPLVLPEVGEDEEWVPRPDETPDDLGAESLAPA